MKVTQSSPSFRPVIIELETEDDVDKLMAILSAVAENRINHSPAIIRAAIDIRSSIEEFLD